jgi:excisionase family DNA binding protein
VEPEIDVAHWVRIIQEAPPERAAVLCACFGQLAAIAAARLLEPPGMTGHADNGELTVTEAAQRLGVSTKWLYRRAPMMPFARRLGPRTLRFERAGLEAWIKRRR